MFSIREIGAGLPTRGALFCACFILTISSARARTTPHTDTPPHVDFRCNRMQIYTGPDRAVCSKNVVLRRAQMWLCCDTFEGTQSASHKTAGQFDRLTCHGNVRAQRGEEIMWADEAVFMVTNGKLILSGRPLLQRGVSLLAGRRIIVDTTLDRAYIESPSGRVNQAERLDTLATLEQATPLPRQCPLKPRPQQQKK